MLVCHYGAPAAAWRDGLNLFAATASANRGLKSGGVHIVRRDVDLLRYWIF